jgi:hypothetical protein
MLVTLLGAVALAAPEPYAPLPTQEFTEEINRNWRGVGIGYDNGLWGQQFAQGLKVDVPFGPKVGQFAGIRVRGLMVNSWNNVIQDQPLYLVGGELFGRGPVWAGIVRVYGGGGVWYGTTEVAREQQDGIAAGGHYGVEAILFERGSFTFEIGGQSGIDGDGPGLGASVMAGIMFYLGGLGGS